MKNEDEAPLVRMINISKRFGNVQALKNIDLEVRRSEVLGLLGDNGAGKSTLIKVLLGLYSPDSGEIYFEGKRVHFKSPRDARARGIEPVYQEMALVDLMNIWRNFFIGRELTKKISLFRFLDQKKMDKTSLKSLKDMGLRVRSAEEKVSLLSGGERQSIAISRAIHFGVKLLVLDEPTASLSIKEAAKVCDYVREAKKRGLSVIFITHNIYHVYPVADRFTILDRGIKLGDYTQEEVKSEDITQMIATGVPKKRS